MAAMLTNTQQYHFVVQLSLLGFALAGSMPFTVLGEICPGREHEQLVGKRTGIINRMKAAFVRLGIRGFNPKLRNAPERLAALPTPGSVPSREWHSP
jgi:hypothetical protein